MVPPSSPPDVTWLGQGIQHILRAIPLNTKSLLDVGSGRGLVGALCRIYRSPRKPVGLDVFAPYLNHCRWHRLYDDVVRVDLSRTLLPFRDRSFDVATGIEVLEHISKEAGLRMLSELERVTSRVALTTPAVFFQQRAYDCNPNQLHRSFWSVKELEHRGYIVYGVGGPSALARHPRVAAGLVAVTYLFPRLSTDVLCVRERKGLGNGEEQVLE